MENPYVSPAASQPTRPPQDWKPNTELSSWSLGLIALFYLLDGPFFVFVQFRETPWQYVFTSLAINTVALAPVAIMLFVDGLRAVRAAPKRMLSITALTLLHLWIVLQHG